MRLNTVDALPISQSNVALNFFAAGLCDLIMDKGLTPPSLIGELRKKPYFHSAPYLGNFFLRFNCSRPPFNDPRVRQAFSLVIDKKLITDKITRAGEQPAYSFVPPGTAGYQPPGPGLGYDPERARRLLAEAGFPGGKNFPGVSFLYNGGEQNQYIGIELKSMFERELGVSLSLRPQENKVYLQTMSTLNYDLARSSWIGDYNDPNTFLDVWTYGRRQQPHRLVGRALRRAHRRRRDRTRPGKTLRPFPARRTITHHRANPDLPVVLLCRRPALRRRATRRRAIQPSRRAPHPRNVPQEMTP